ncbi:collagen-binding domain-containing protein [Clostridium paraputrificum]|uniref:collagen-binding domain-containing protein n=1 Tax=Clostridium paraputrificum TaxID=29363 RepID=UPI003D325501
MNKGMDRKLRRLNKKQIRKPNSFFITLILSLTFMLATSLFSGSSVEAINSNLFTPETDNTEAKVKLSDTFDKDSPAKVYEEYEKDKEQDKDQDTISIEEKQSILARIPGSKILTNDTFTSLGGSYTLKHILKNYNIFAFEDIEGTHVVGPIVTKNKAYRTSGYGITANSTFIASDYSKGVHSYVGILEPLNNSDKATVNLNYGFDFKKNLSFKEPNLYISSFNDLEKNQNSGKHTVYSKDDKAFTGPSNTGYGPIFQNDNFINFEEARSALLKESGNLASRTDSIEVSPEVNTGYLKIEAGKSYLIKDASRLRIVDIQYPEGYDPVKNHYPYPTIINIVDDSLAISGETFKERNITAADGSSFYVANQSLNKIDGKVHQFFPGIFVNGKIFDGGTGAGEGFEYGEDNGVIWNMPNIKTKNDGYRVATDGNYDILGHIIAPNAEFWNYNEKSPGEVTWSGGNMNGCAIVESWHGGTRESHMWPLALTDIDPPIKKDLLLVGKKNFSGGNLKEYNFKFTLGLLDGGSIPDGVVNKNIPQTVSSKEDGSIEFLPITFNKEGSYTFNIKEVIDEKIDKEIIYDKSEYKVDVTVKKNAETNTFDITYIITKIKDSKGELLYKPETVDKLIFNNSKPGYMLPATGGIGNSVLMIIGTVMILTSTSLLIKRRYKIN